MSEQIDDICYKQIIENILTNEEFNKLKYI